MPMDLEVDSIDKVPEKFRSLYTKDAAGKFKLDADLAKDLDVSGLTSALDKERKKAKDYEKQVTGWKALELGETPEEALERIKEQMDGELGDEDSKKLLRKLKEDAANATAKVKSEYEGKLTTMQESLKKQMIDSEATLAISELKGAPALLLPHVRSQCLLLEEDGQYCVRVVDAEGDPRGNGKGGFMTIKELVAEMRNSEVFGRAFEPSDKKGSGTRSSEGTGNRDGSQKMTSIQKISAGLNKRR